MSDEGIQVAGIILAVILAVFAVMIIARQAFPVFEYAKSRALFEIQGDLGQRSGVFLWDARSIDIVAQAFVLFASALGCLAILKAERR
ncbi:MAG: hypothetical protein J7J94_03770 [Thaumarchaeota archaeon]|nr:hypothetical protein [Nitrososphaerota archaeon]